MTPQTEGHPTPAAGSRGAPPPFAVRRLSDVLAAEVVGLDLATPLDAATRSRIYAAFLEHQVLVFRDQRLGKAEQIAFTEQFGVLERHALGNRGSDEFPLLHVVSNLDAEGRPGKPKSMHWHSDKSFRPQPSMATVLHAVTLPPGGGDTCFANMYAAYEALPAARRAELDRLRVVHSWELSRANIGRVVSEEEKRDAPPMVHPLARVHPDTGRRCLFVGIHASHIEGMRFEEGRALVEELEAHATRPEFVYRHRWRPGDVLMWDNRCLLHRADSNFEVASHPRILHRTCLRGTPTGGEPA